METVIISFQSLSAEKVEQNEDLMNLILFRMPAKSLVRFKCVSKRWLSLISDSTFADNHTRNNLNLLVSGLYIDSCPMLSFKTNSPNGHQSLPKLNFAIANQSGVTILHSYNGLMLCSRGPEFIVCNVTTQKLKILPSYHDPNWALFPLIDDEKFIAFDPTKSPHYKVVFLQISDNDLDRLFETDGSCYLYIYYADTYSSKSRTWKRISFSHFGTYPFTEKVFCDGSVYWIDEEGKLFKFNIDEEKWEIIQPSSHPLIRSNEYRKVMLGEFGGRLFLVQEIRSAKFGLRVLEMNMDTFHWSIKFTIDLGPAINTLPAELNIRDLWSVQVLCLKNGDDQENPILIFAIKGKIISYNPNGDCVEILEGILGDAHGTNKRVHKFIESLATV